VSECDVFVKFNNEDDIECQRTKYAMKNGDSIKIIDFDEFLKMLDLTREELDGSPMVSFECLYRDDAKIDDKKIKKYFQRTKKELVTVPFEEHSAKLGDLCPNLYEFRRKLLEEEDK
jgi:hypothetical protein